MFIVIKHKLSKLEYLYQIDQTNYDFYPKLVLEIKGQMLMP